MEVSTSVLALKSNPVFVFFQIVDCDLYRQNDKCCLLFFAVANPITGSVEPTLLLVPSRGINFSLSIIPLFTKMYFHFSGTGDDCMQFSHYVVIGVLFTQCLNMLFFCASHCFLGVQNECFIFLFLLENICSEALCQPYCKWCQAEQHEQY